MCVCLHTLRFTQTLHPHSCSASDGRGEGMALQASLAAEFVTREAAPLGVVTQDLRREAAHAAPRGTLKKHEVIQRALVMVLHGDQKREAVQDLGVTCFETVRRTQSSQALPTMPSRVRTKFRIWHSITMRQRDAHALSVCSQSSGASRSHSSKAGSTPHVRTGR